MVVLVKHLGALTVAFVGHDHGARTGWLLTSLYPPVVACYFALFVSNAGRTSFAPHAAFRKWFGDEKRPKGSE